MSIIAAAVWAACGYRPQAACLTVIIDSQLSDIFILSDPVYESGLKLLASTYIEVMSDDDTSVVPIYLHHH